MLLIALQLQGSRSGAERGRYTDFLILSTHRWRTASGLRQGRSGPVPTVLDPADFAA
jgi:hypothetical protein